jgi:hypothetical protein
MPFDKTLLARQAGYIQRMNELAVTIGGVSEKASPAMLNADRRATLYGQGAQIARSLNFVKSDIAFTPTTLVKEQTLVTVDGRNLIAAGFEEDALGVAIRVDFVEPTG